MNKIIRFLIISLLTLLAITAVTIGSIFAFIAWESRPKIINKLSGVAIGEHLDEVTFKKGALKNLSDDVYYPENNGRLVIYTNQNRVEALYEMCAKPYSYAELNSISCGSNSEKITEKFGNDVRVLCPTDDQTKLVRAYDVVKYGVRYLLTQNEVDGFLIASPSVLKSYVGKNWRPCITSQD